LAPAATLACYLCDSFWAYCFVSSRWVLKKTPSESRRMLHLYIYYYYYIIYIWNSVWWFSLKAGWSQVLAVHADDASGILARSNGLSSQDKELCKEPTICCWYLFFGTPSEPTCWFFMRMKKLIVFRRFGSLGV
jgi:hypothetical protein